MSYEHDAQRGPDNPLTQVGDWAQGVTDVGGIADGVWR